MEVAVALDSHRHSPSKSILSRKPVEIPLDRILETWHRLDPLLGFQPAHNANSARSVFCALKGGGREARKCSQAGRERAPSFNPPRRTNALY